MKFKIADHYFESMDVDAAVKLHHLPYLVHPVFDYTNKDVTISPSTLNRMLQEYCTQMISSKGPEEAKAMALKALACAGSGDSISAPQYGFSGLGGLTRLNFSAQDEQEFLVRFTRTKFRAIRCGRALAFQAFDMEGKVHRSSSEVLDALAEKGELVRHFVQQYLFTTDCQVVRHTDSQMVFPLEKELKEMARYVPDAVWHTSPSVVAKELFNAFRSRGLEEKTKPIATCGDVKIHARITCGMHRLDAGRDEIWKAGFLPEIKDDVLYFVTNAGQPAIEYSVSTYADSLYTSSFRHDLDHWDEQMAMRDVARMLYSGLYQRRFCERLKNNPHFLHFLPKKAARAAAD